jgi:hypothetical protein
VTTSLTYLLSTGIFVGGLAIVALVLLRYRDRLQAKFGVQSAVRSIVQVTPQARLALVDVEGMTVLCALGRDGITAMQIVTRPQEQPL